MRRPLAAIALSAMLLLAGCVGSLPGGEPTLDDVEYPPGVTDAGTNATQLVDAHEAGLENRSFTLHMNVSGETANRTQSFGIRSAVGADRDRMLVHANVSAATMDLYLTEDTVYRRTLVGDQTRYDVRERTPRALQLVPASTTGATFLRQYLATANFTPSGVTVEDGTTLVVLTADADSVVNTAVVNVSRLDARVLVSEQGVVHRATIDYAITRPDGETMSTATTIRITDVGETDVSEPDWLDEAKEQAES